MHKLSGGGRDGVEWDTQDHCLTDKFHLSSLLTRHTNALCLIMKLCILASSPDPNGSQGELIV